MATFTGDTTVAKAVVVERVSIFSKAWQLTVVQYHQQLITAPFVYVTCLNKTGLLEVLAVCIFGGGHRTGAHFSSFCKSTPVFTVDTRTLLDKLFDSHGPSSLLVSFEGSNNDMLLLKSQAAVIYGHNEVGVITHPDTSAMGISHI